MVTKLLAQPESVFEALGDGTRREILALLRKGPLPVGAIAERLPVSRPAVSKHLRILRNAGLVESEADGTRNLFELDDSGFRAAREYLDGFWDVALRSFERLVAEEVRRG